MKAFAICAAMTLFAVGIVSVARATHLIRVPQSAYTGNSYRIISNEGLRSYYVAGVVDGLLNGPLIGADEKVTEGLHQCLLQFRAAQVVAIVDKYLADHPEQWHHDMPNLVLSALGAACPDYEELRRHYFDELEKTSH